MSLFGRGSRQCLVMISSRSFGVEREVKLVLPAELEACLGKRVVVHLGSGMSLRQVCGVGGNLVGNDSVFYVVFIWQAQMLLWGDVAEHGRSVPANHCCADRGGDVIVTWGNVGCEGTKCVERGFVAELHLEIYVLFDFVQGDMTRALDHNLYIVFPGNTCQFTQCLQFGKLCCIVSVGDRTGTQAVAKREGDVVGT